MLRHRSQLYHVPNTLSLEARRKKCACSMTDRKTGSGKSEAVEEMERENWSQKVSKRTFFADFFWMTASVLSTSEKAICFSLLAYRVCSNRAIKSVGIIVREAACDPYHFLLPSSP